MSTQFNVEDVSKSFWPEIEAMLSDTLLSWDWVSSLSHLGLVAVHFFSKWTTTF